MVNNFEEIKPLLKFNSKDDFYFVQLLKRKKDHKDGEKVSGVNNNARLVKAYYIKSIEHLDYVTPEIIELCKLFNARAGINLNKRSFEKMALQHLRKVTDQILSKDFHKAHKAYSSVVGAYNQDSDKSWIIDIDTKNLNTVSQIIEEINKVEPLDIDNKKKALLSSKNGWHLITKPFNQKKFKDNLELLAESGKFDKTDIPEIHKNNPTNLFIP